MERLKVSTAVIVVAVMTGMSAALAQPTVSAPAHDQLPDRPQIHARPLPIPADGVGQGVQGQALVNPFAPTRLGPVKLGRPAEDAIAVDAAIWARTVEERMMALGTQVPGLTGVVGQAVSMGMAFLFFGLLLPLSITLWRLTGLFDRVLRPDLLVLRLLHDGAAYWNRDDHGRSFSWRRPGSGPASPRPGGDDDAGRVGQGS